MSLAKPYLSEFQGGCETPGEKNGFIKFCSVWGGQERYFQTVLLLCYSQSVEVLWGLNSTYHHALMYPAWLGSLGCVAEVTPWF